MLRRFFSSGSSPKFNWKLGTVNHIAIATSNLPQATAFYRDILRAKVSAPLDLPEHGVRTVFVDFSPLLNKNESVGGEKPTKIELLEPLGQNSPIQNFLKRQPGGGIHHVCIEVDDVYKAVKDLQEKKVRVLDPEPKIGAHGKPVVFLHPKDCGGVLVELEQK